MITRNKRTIDVYENAGAYMRLLKTVGTKAMTAISPLLYAKDSDKFVAVLNWFALISSRLEDKMLSDHPNLDNKYLDVFYGNLSDNPRNQIDEKMITMAKEKVDELFKRE